MEIPSSFGRDKTGNTLVDTCYECVTRISQTVHTERYSKSFLKAYLYMFLSRFEPFGCALVDNLRRMKMNLMTLLLSMT